MNPEKRGRSPLKRFTEAAILAGALAGSPDAAQAAEPVAAPVEESSEISYTEKINFLKEYVDQNGTRLPDGSKVVNIFYDQLVLERGTLYWQADEGMQTLSPDVLKAMPYLDRLISDLQSKKETGESSGAQKQIESLKEMVRASGSPITIGSKTEKIFTFADGELILTADGQLQLQRRDKPGIIMITNGADLSMNNILITLLETAHKK